MFGLLNEGGNGASVRPMDFGPSASPNTGLAIAASRWRTSLLLQEHPPSNTPHSVFPIKQQRWINRLTTLNSYFWSLKVFGAQTCKAFSLEELQGTNYMGQTGFCKILRCPAFSVNACSLLRVFCEDLRASQMLQFLREANFSQSLRKSAKDIELGFLCPFKYVPFYAKLQRTVKVGLLEYCWTPPPPDLLQEVW